VARERRKLHNEHLYNLFTYNENDQANEDEMSRAGDTNGGEEECI
jgi:hypothetical protein